MKIVVCGDAQLAHELGQLCLEAGHDVAHFDVEEIERLLSDDGQGEAFRQWEIAVDVENLHVDAKRHTVQTLSRLVGKTGFVLSLVYATSVTQAASWMGNPHNLVGFGVVLPLTTPGIVELAKGLQTSEEAMSRAKALWKSLGMDVVEVQEGPGLVRARTICCLINEAASALQEGVATAEDIDAAMRLGTNYPYGPLEWADIIGLDNVLAVMNGLHSEYGEDRYRPSPILKRMAAAGRVGKKTGHGFFVHKTDATGAAE